MKAKTYFFDIMKARDSSRQIHPRGIRKAGFINMLFSKSGHQPLKYLACQRQLALNLLWFYKISNGYVIGVSKQPCLLCENGLQNVTTILISILDLFWRQDTKRYMADGKRTDLASIDKELSQRCGKKSII
jgi:hypothetical protein